MRATVNFGMWGSGAEKNMAVIRLAESLGYDSIWTAEASGTDAVVPLAWIAAQTTRIKLGTAILQMSARSPTTTATTAATLDLLSGGRLILGLGVSGPMVVEGWHGQPFGRPLTKTREYVHIVRSVLARQEITHQGDHYRIPYLEDDGTGLAGPVRMMFRPRRTSIPIYLAAMGERNVALAHEIADGVLPAFYSPTHEDVFFAGVEPSRRTISVSPFVLVSLGADVMECRRRLKPTLAFWIGGMGAKGKNFYNDFISRIGFRDAAATAQELYTSGRRSSAAAAIPDELVDAVALCGPVERVRDQVAAWKESAVTTMILNCPDVATVKAMAEIVL